MIDIVCNFLEVVHQPGDLCQGLLLPFLVYLERLEVIFKTLLVVLVKDVIHYLSNLHIVSGITQDTFPVQVVSEWTE